MRKNTAFYSLSSKDEKICPLCGKYHTVNRYTKELDRTHFSTRWIYEIECKENNKIMRFESLFKMDIESIWFERKDVVETKKEV